MLSVPPRVTIYEVGPRDGLQNEARNVPAAEKLQLIQALADAGLQRIEATSFVSAKWIPQVGDADDVAPKLERRAGVTYSALVPNAKGLERFLAHDALGTVAVFLSASETHNRKNVNRTIAESLKGF